jgi:hypothetical protein
VAKFLKKFGPTLAKLGGTVVDAFAPGVGTATLGAWSNAATARASATAEKQQIKAQMMSAGPTSSYAGAMGMYGTRMPGGGGGGFIGPTLSMMEPGSGMAGDPPPGMSQAEWDGAWQVLSGMAQGFSDAMVRQSARKAKVGKRVLINALPYVYSLDIGAAAGMQEWILTGRDKADLSDRVEQIFRHRARPLISKSLIRWVNQLRFVRKALSAVGGNPVGRKRGR